MARGLIHKSALIVVLFGSPSAARRHDTSAKPAVADVASANALLQESSEFPVNHAIAPLLAATSVSVKQHGIHSPGRLQVDRHPTAHAATPRAFESDAAEVASVAPARPLPAPLIASSPLLEEVAARGYGAPSGALVMPAEWERKLERGSVVALRCADSASASYYVASAKLLASPEFQVQIMAGRSDMPETVRELLVSQLLSQTGCVPTFFERQVFPDATFMMTEHVGSRTLQALVQERSLRANGGPAVPLKQALPLMIDLLRGLQSMEHLSIVHGDLTEGNVYLVDGDRRAVITSFQHACLKDTTDERLLCLAEQCPPPAGSELRQAPEALGKQSVGVPGNVWQLGLVFARMLFGGEVPTEAAVLREMPPQDMARLAGLAMRSRSDDPDDQAVRKQVRDIIRQHFSIQEAEGFQSLKKEHEDVLTIVEGMLAKDPTERLTASQALQTLEQVCIARDVPVPARRPQAVLPEGVAEDWQ